ncbi:hypothetical protein LL584_35175 [Streptomyces malaysiensis subsp. malaysiensis]|nr:hypothetical protein [Streptomyces malaysiensis]
MTLVRRGCRTGARYEAVAGAGPVLEALELAAYKGLKPVEGDHGGVGQ